IWLIVLRKPTDYLSDERWVQGFTNEMIGDLKGLAGGERHFFETHETYSTELRALDSARWFFSPNAHPDVSPDARTWSATAHRRATLTPSNRTDGAQREPVQRASFPNPPTRFHSS